MSRRTLRCLVVLGLAGVFAVALAVTARAGSTAAHASDAEAAPGVGQQHECPPVHGTRWVFPSSTMKASSELYESFATGVSCSQAAVWTRRLASTRLDATVGNPSSLSGPSGFTCYGYPDLHGHAYVGSCVKANAIFGWNFNQMTIPAYTEPGLPKTLGGASDIQGSLTSLGHGRYRLSLRNISPKGTIDSVAWTPPELTITAVTSSRGGVCRLTSNGGISCKGRLRQPGCLCDGSGGALTVVFTARRNPGSTSQPGLDGRALHVTSLTPVPHLVPSTKKAQANNKT